MEAAGVDVIQFDEPGLNVFLDEVTGWGAPALERAAAGFSCKTAVHMCYGCEVETNIAWKGTLGARWRRYEKTFPAINASAIGQVSVEAVSSKAPIDLIGLLPDKEIDRAPVPRRQSPRLPGAGDQRGVFRSTACCG